jgi:hypothetical protein
MFQAEMSVLLRELKERDTLDPDDQDIATQLCRVLQEHPHIPEARVLSEIGILFVEGFETTGARARRVRVCVCVCVAVWCAGWSVVARACAGTAALTPPDTT